MFRKMWIHNLIIISVIFFTLIISNIYVSLLFCISFLFISVFSKSSNTRDKSWNTVNKNKLESFLSKLGDKNFKLFKTTGRSGFSIYRYNGNNIYVVPQNTINSSEDLQHAKAVLAHEFCHINNKHAIKVRTLKYTSVFISVIIMYYLSQITEFYIILMASLFFSLIVTLVTNYLRHIFEYHCDQFASEVVSEKAVIDRLRKNTHLSYDPKYTTYISTHPNIDSRIERIHSEDS